MVKALAIENGTNFIKGCPWKKHTKNSLENCKPN